MEWCRGDLEGMLARMLHLLRDKRSRLSDLLLELTFPSRRKDRLIVCRLVKSVKHASP
ncbi:hypothetical protein A2U01_0032972, partial [Trifolium medium]|nr:hypothetical protein [Trifolium medium]